MGRELDAEGVDAGNAEDLHIEDKISVIFPQISAIGAAGNRPRRLLLLFASGPMVMPLPM